MVQVSCSSCNTLFNLEDNLRGKRIRCLKCQQVVSVPPADPAPESAPKAGGREPLAPSEPRLTQDTRPASVKKVKQEQVTSATPSAPPARTAPRRPAALDRDEGPALEKPERTASTIRKPVWFIVGGAGAAVLLLVGIGVGALLKSSGSGKPTEPGAPAAVATSGGTGGPAAGKEEPSTPTPSGKLDAKGIARIKQATVYLKVRMSNGSSAEGTGFFAAEAGHVLTNAHVVGMLEPNTAAPRQIEVVLNSGEKEETTLTGLVLGVDRGSDLAVLRVQGEDQRLPAPLPVEADSAGLTDLQKVLIFGFPLGAGLGKEITISESSIASLRKDTDGQLYQIQLNGGMHPGNSGGPIVDTRGVVIGVAVAGISGTTINFAVPGSKIQEMLHGRVLDTRLGEPFLEQQQLKLPVHVALLDPLRRIREVQVEYWTGPEGSPRPATRIPPTPVPGDAPRQSVALSYNTGLAKQDVALGQAPAGHVHWVQPVFVDPAGKRRWGAAIAFKSSGAAPLQRVPVNLTVNTRSQQRTLQLTSRMALVLSKGKEQVEFADQMDMTLLETLEQNPKGDAIKLVIGKGNFYSVENGRRVPRNLAAQSAVRKNVYTFQADDTARLTGFSFVNHKFRDPVLTDEANDMSSNVTMSYQATCLGLPNRQVAPLETWETKIRMLYGAAGKKKDALDVVLTCTYEGSRTVNEKTEALIRLTGEINLVNTEKTPAFRQPNDRVDGYAVFDPAAGMVTRLQLALRAEAVTENNTLIARIFSFGLVRTPGNPQGITVPDPRVAPKKES